MNDRELILDAMRRMGKTVAESVQVRSTSMSGTELNAEDDYIPTFRAAVTHMNMLERPIGFVCKSTAGRVVRLLQPYDSEIYTQEPEELSAQFGFVWSTDPKKAKPFAALSTSPYNTGECCLNKAGEPRRSKIDNNVFDPDASPEYWEDPYSEEGM